MTYIGAPYNFVPFSRTVRHYESESLPGHNSVDPRNEKGDDELIVRHYESESLPGHNNVDPGNEKGDDELISGELSYEITAVSDLFIGNGTRRGRGEAEPFYSDAYGRFAIPGSTVRGLIRSNAQILSLSEIGGDIDDYSLMFRNVASGPKKQKDRYANILGARPVQVTDRNGNKTSITVLEKVRAGYISCNNGVYTIDDVAEPAPRMDGQKTNYYILSERTVIHDYLAARRDRRPCAYPLFFPNGKNILQHDNKREFRAEFRDGKQHYVNDKNNSYEPYALPCSYSVSGRTILKVDAPHRLAHEGYAVSSGRMNEKKAIYIIPARKTKYDVTEKTFPIKMKEDDVNVKSFLTDLKRRETTLKQFGGRKHFDLPGEGETKPVFYIGGVGGSRLYFGFTPRLRLFYDHTIAEGIPAKHKEGKLDYAKALFGYSTKDKSYKSRLSFTDAVISESKESERAVPVILAEPKPTSYLDYVVPDGGEGQSYNEDTFELRGIKQYWLRDQAKADVPADKLGKEYVSWFAPLPAKTKFKGKIRFHNLKKEELGLLIWSISLNGRAEMNIGKAKAFGYGRIKMDISKAVRQNPAMAYDLTHLALAPWKKLNTNTLVNMYKEKLRAHLGKRPEDEEAIKVLLQMKDPLVKPDDEKTRFMSIDAREYQNRTEPLQKATDLTKNVKTAVTTDTVYSAEVTKIEGKKISFRMLNAEGNYGKFSVEDIVCREVSKKELKTLLQKGARIEVRMKSEEDNSGWECVKLPE